MYVYMFHSSLKGVKKTIQDLFPIVYPSVMATLMCRILFSDRAGEHAKNEGGGEGVWNEVATLVLWANVICTFGRQSLRDLGNFLI